MELQPVLKELAVRAPMLPGLVSYVPGLFNVALERLGGGGTLSASYCYSVWLRHLKMAAQHGLTKPPRVVAELGPGDSIGMGLAAMISGADQYYAFDVVRYANNRRNVQIFDELVRMFQQRSPIPDQRAFPEAKPLLADYDFPHSILTEEHLATALNPERLTLIRAALISESVMQSNGIQLAYFVPWNEPTVVKQHSVDMIFSQAVLEHVEGLAYTYRAFTEWLKPGGWMSHVVDFRCHGTAKVWNGHWAYSDFVWKYFIKAKRPYLINRQPHSAHLRFLEQFGFEVVCDAKTPAEEGLPRAAVAPNFQHLPEEDFKISATFLQSIKQ